MKRTMSGPSSWAGMYPQPEAFSDQPRPPAKFQGSCFSKAGKKSHRYPMTRLTGAQKAALFAALRGLLKMEKSVHIDSCACHNFSLHPAMESILCPSSQGRERQEILISSAPFPQIWVGSSSLFLSHRWRCVCQVQDSMPRSSPWTSSFPSTLRWAPLCQCPPASIFSPSSRNPLPSGYHHLCVFMSTSYQHVQNHSSFYPMS